MQEISALLGISIALAIGAASPGPSFVLVARTAVSSSRVAGLVVALGMGIGGMVFAALSLLGLHGLLSAVPALYVALKIVGGLYLAYLGFRIWRGANKPLGDIARSDKSPEDSMWRALALGVMTQLSNPKTAIVYASVFAAFLPDESSHAFDISLVALVLVIEAGWYSIVALALSTEGPRQVYLHYKAGVDRVVGGVMVALGIKLFVSSST